MMRLPVLAAVFALTLGAAAWADEAALIEPQALALRIEAGDASLLVLDVRSAEEFDEGHLPQAVNIPYDALAGRLAELGMPGERDIAVYCRSGRRSAIALTTLKDAGFSRLFHVNGDWLRWSAENRPIVRPSAQP